MGSLLLMIFKPVLIDLTWQHHHLCCPNRSLTIAKFGGKPLNLNAALLRLTIPESSALMELLLVVILSLFLNQGDPRT